jgi:hypothetical protein
MLHTGPSVLHVHWLLRTPPVLYSSMSLNTINLIRFDAATTTPTIKSGQRQPNLAERILVVLPAHHVSADPRLDIREDKTSSSHYWVRRRSEFTQCQCLLVGHFLGHFWQQLRHQAVYFRTTNDTVGHVVTRIQDRDREAIILLIFEDKMGAWHQIGGAGMKIFDSPTGSRRLPTKLWSILRNDYSFPRANYHVFTRILFATDLSRNYYRYCTRRSERAITGPNLLEYALTTLWPAF